MGRVLIIGAGGVATVAAHKVAQNPEVFTEVMIASRTKSKCDKLAQVLNEKYGIRVQTAPAARPFTSAIRHLSSGFSPKPLI